MRKQEPPMPSVVVLVLAWNGRNFLPTCLRALEAQQFGDQWAVLVVDNGSTDGSPELVRSEFPDVALITNRTNLGFGKGNNFGIQTLLDGTAPGVDFVPDIIVLLNQDTEVAPDWLAQLIAPFEHDEQIGIVGCKLLFPDGRLQHAGGLVLWPLATGMHRGTGEQDTGQYDNETTADYVTAAAVAVHRRVWETVGLFDAGFTPAYYEDVDLCYRARAAGFEIVYTPHAIVTHYENASLQGQSAAHQRAYHRNRIRFVLKYIQPHTFSSEFIAAECDEIGRWSVADSLARKHAYLHGLLMLPEVLRQRADIDDLHAGHAQFAHVLHTLHDAVVAEERTRRALVAEGIGEQMTEEQAPPTEQQEARGGEPGTGAAGAPVPRTENREPENVAREVGGEGNELAPEEHASCFGHHVSGMMQAEQEEQRGMTIQDQSDKGRATTTGQPAPDPVNVAAVMQQIRRRISARHVERTDAELDATLHQVNQQWDKVYEPLNVTPAGSPIGLIWRFFRVRIHREVRSYLDPMIFRQTDFNASVVRAINILARRPQADASDEVEALRDELMQLRERVRQLEEQVKAE
jgi:GT2 family glycosyltransferase